MENEEANQEVLGKKSVSEETGSESSEQNTTRILKDSPPSETDPNNTSDENAESGALERENNESILISTDLEKDHCDAIELPSTVTDREEIFMPNGIEIEDPRIYGKWMLFFYGDLKRQDQVWIQLQDLVLRGDAILLKSSTAKTTPDYDQSQGAIMCYTSEDKGAIKRAGVAIQDIVKDDIVLNYKTNEDSNKKLYRRFGSRFIAKYMLLANGKLYERDYLDRWKKVTHSSTETPPVGRSSGECLPLNKIQKQECSDLFPSREHKIPRYVYPKDKTLKNCSGIWSFFCDAVEVDCVDGSTELDRMWQQAVALCDERCFSSASCQTHAFKLVAGENSSRRCVTCTLEGYTDVDRVVQTGDKLRVRTSHNYPMYFKVCCREPKKKLQYYMKYMYTEDGELYEHDAQGWKLLRRKQ